MPKPAPKQSLRRATGKVGRNATQISAAKAARTYRGVELQMPAGTSRFSARQLDEAVRFAIAKNAHVFAVEG